MKQDFSSDFHEAGARRRPHSGRGARPAAPADRGEALVQGLKAAAAGDDFADLRAWLAALDAAIAAMERTAFSVRELVDESVGLWKALQDGFKPFQSRLSAFQQKAQRTPALTRRATGTAWTLTQIAMSYRLFGTRSAFLARDQVRPALDALHAKNAERFYTLSVKQGGAFLKIGQMLSARPDLLPRPWIDQLSGLQDAAPAEPWEQVRETLEQELGAPLEAHFSSFEQAPIAAASIGQVHRAVTRAGETVAVKVQRPQIEQHVELDMLLLEHFLPALGAMLPPTDYDTIVSEVKAMVRLELCYEQEAQAMARMHTLFAGHKGVRVPQPLLSLCTSKVITSQYVEGENLVRALDRLQTQAADSALAAKGPDLRDEVLGTLLEVYLRQVLELGFFQADPHPGNFLVTPEGELVLLDFGSCKQLDEKFRRGYLDLARAILGEDEKRMKRLFDELGFRTESGGHATLIAFANAAMREMRTAAVTGAAFKWPSKQEAFAHAVEALEAAQRDPVVRLPAEFIMLGRVFGTLGGLFAHYKPQLNYAQRVLPHVMQAVATPRAAASA